MVKKDVLDLTFSKVPMFKAMMALILGILIGNFSSFSAVAYLPYFIITNFLLLILFFFKQFATKRRQLFTLLFYIFIVLTGIWIISKNKPQNDTLRFSHKKAIQIIGIIADEPTYKEKTIRFPLDISGIIDSNGYHSAQGKIMLSIARDSVQQEVLNYGDEILFKNTVTETSKPLNPKEFDYQKYLKNKGIYHQAFLQNTKYKVLQKDNGNFVLSHSLAIRQKLIIKFSKYIKDPEAYQIAVALIFGYRSQVEASTIDAFTNTGTIHILSVSGLHVSLVFGLLTFLLFWMDRIKHGKLMRSLLIFFAVWMYVILTGMSPPILRAGIMISFFIVSTAFGRRQIGLNTLFASALFILILAPEYLFDVGFQLSYAAILGILILYPMLKEFWIPNNKWLSLIIEYCYVSIAAQLFTLPLALYYFGQFPIYFLVANLFIAIPSTIIMYLGVILALSPFSALSILLGKLLDFCLIFSVKGLKYIAQLPMSVSKGIVWDFWQTSLLSLALIFLIIALNYANKRMMFATLLSLLVVNIYTIINQIQYNSYQGNRIYSIRSEIAIAHIDQGKVTLCTTLDSLHHPTLKYSVLPDLLRYTKEKNIMFVHLRNEKKNNYSLKLGKRTFLIVEEKYNSADAINPNFVLWRKNNRNNVQDFLAKNKDVTLIIDGSNSQKSIDKLNKDVLNTKNTYLLKNNFAYVWEGD